jgi:hypothetical protein
MPISKTRKDDLSVEQQLKQELAALRHELRRVNDSLEGNRSHQMERRASQLRDNIALCEEQLKRLNSPLQ